MVGLTAGTAVIKSAEDTTTGWRGVVITMAKDRNLRMKRSTRLAGHTLPNEGRVYDPYGYRLSEAAARCSCGEESPVLPNDAQRRKWHANHKQALRDREA